MRLKLPRELQADVHHPTLIICTFMLRSLALFTLVLAPTSHAAGVNWCDLPQAHPIDAAFAAAIERSGGVTADMRDAQGLAYEGWDTELNRIYRELMLQLGGDMRADALRQAQRAWLAWDDAEAVSDLAMQQDSGSAGPLVIADQSLTRRRDRACTLYRLLEPSPSS